jgi:predicted regulator of amino acid metabolism with ACT domain
MITNKTQTERDIDQIEKLADNTIRAINSAIYSLNNAHQVFWGLPDDRLNAVLQKLYDDNQLIPLFANHEYGAKSLNEIKRRLNSEGVTAIATAGREFEIVDGVVALIAKEQPVIQYNAVVDPQTIIEENAVDPQTIIEENEVDPQTIIEESDAHPSL